MVRSCGHLPSTPILLSVGAKWNGALVFMLQCLRGVGNWIRNVNLEGRGVALCSLYWSLVFPLPFQRGHFCESLLLEGVSCALNCFPSPQPPWERWTSTPPLQRQAPDAHREVTRSRSQSLQKNPVSQLQVQFSFPHKSRVHSWLREICGDTYHWPLSRGCWECSSWVVPLIAPPGGEQENGTCGHGSLVTGFFTCREHFDHVCHIAHQ